VKKNAMSALWNRIWATAALLLAALLVVTGVPAQAKTIANTASARWAIGDHQITATSNTVEFEVISNAAHIAVLQPLSAGDTREIAGGTCGGKPLAAVKADTAALSAGNATSISSIIVGQPVIFRLVLAPELLDPATIDTIEVKLTSASGDNETIIVAETAANSGMFFGAIPTSAIPPSPTAGDCRLSVSPGDKVTLEYRGQTGSGTVASAAVDVLADPFGLVFDSEDGTPVDGARVTMIDVATGQPAQVFADDGVTPWPSSVITGQAVTDGAGTIWPMPVGEYRFPLAALGTYRLLVEPPAPYLAPSTLTPTEFAGLTRPDGGDLVIVPASFGGALTLSSPAPVRVDIPVDRPPVAVTLTKTASRQVAQPGDAVFYKVLVRNPDAGRAKRRVVLVDKPSPTLRLRKSSIRVDGVRASDDMVTITPDGRSFTIMLGTIAPSALRTVTYAMTVRPSAPPGQAVNRVEATDSRGLTAIASAAVRIERDNLASTMTLIGRITLGDCDVTKKRPGLGGVRLVLEDGSFAVTDAEGRYHFEGLAPGTHVVEAQQSSLPEGGEFRDCTRSSRSAGSATSRFVIGQGGSLVVANFAATVPADALAKAKPVAAEPDSDRVAAGGETDWLAQGDGPTEFLFPKADYNPRAPTLRLVIRHRKGQTVSITSNGKPIDKLAFEGARAGAGGSAVSIWRAIPLGGEETRFEAEVREADGKLAQTLTRTVHFTSIPARVELVPELSRLVADGSARPVIAVRVLDRNGHPMHAGISGPFALSAPYESAAALDAMQNRMLAGLDRSAPNWTVRGDQGIALIELAPTLVSGQLDITFPFTDREVKRSQVLEAWIVPGKQKWTLVGLAEGAIGSQSIADLMQRSERFDSDLGKHARVAFYAKGRVLGKFLTTVAYDSAKQRADQRLLGGLDPRAYYTVFADGSDRRFDAASVEKLYVRIESAKVRALYGDFATDFTHSQLGRYQRTMTGVKAEARVGPVRAEGFAAKVATTRRRDQIPGGGLSGPYPLSSRGLVPNSETVTIEVRDRFRSELVLKSEILSRFLDYDIDLLSGTISFKHPVLSRDANLNPQTIVVEYEVDTLNGGAWNAGARAEWRSAKENVRIGATAITDASANDRGAVKRTNLAAIDGKVLLGTKTELRAEVAVSKAGGGGAAKSAWLIEAEHHGAKLDVLAYVRSLDANFGLGQVSVGELGRRKVGIDSRYRLSEAFSIGASAWFDSSLTDPSNRKAVQLTTVWNTPGTEARLGLSRYEEHRADGSANGTGGGTTLAEAGVTKRLFGNRLELSAAGSFAIGKSDPSSYQPPRFRFGGRFAITPDIRLIGDYEIAKGARGDSRTIRTGLEVAPWTGAKIALGAGQQSISEQGKRAFASYGLAQSLPIGKHLTIDATVDGNRIIGGRSAFANVATATVGAASTVSIAEDFTAYTLGGTWRSGRWSATTRAELRNGELNNRKGLTFGVLRQLGEGSVVGGAATWTTARDTNGAQSVTASAAISIAHRPATSPLAFLAKIEFRSDVLRAGSLQATDAVAGDLGPASGSALTVDGNARSRRVVGSVSADWAPTGRVDGAMVQRSEVSVFLAARHNLDRFEGYNLAGTTVLAGVDARIGIGERIEIGGTATVRRSLSDGTTSFAAGPQIGFVPSKNVLLTVGYNVTGFRDRDFGAARSTNKGVFTTLRMKFDSQSLGFLGLGR
jgi:uncharacterized repeat protein (TIGR01451 family)